MMSVFIHFYPPLLFYILRWLPDRVNEAWPEAFNLDYEVQFWPNGSLTGNVVGNTIIVYLFWFIPYTFWQLFIGLDLPRLHCTTKLQDGSPAPTVYDTVYHNIMRSGLCLLQGKLLWNRPKELSLEQCRTNDFELRDFLVYMSVHFFNSMASIVAFAYPASYPNMSILHSYGCCWLSVPTGEGSVTHTTQQRCTQRSFGNISPMRLIQQMRFLHYMWTRRMDTKVLIKFRFNRSSYLDDGLGNSESEHFLKIFIIEVMLS